MAGELAVGQQCWLLGVCVDVSSQCTLLGRQVNSQQESQALGRCPASLLPFSQGRRGDQGPCHSLTPYASRVAPPLISLNLEETQVSFQNTNPPPKPGEVHKSSSKNLLPEGHREPSGVCEHGSRLNSSSSSMCRLLWGVGGGAEPRIWVGPSMTAATHARESFFLSGMLLRSSLTTQTQVLW